jgi:hypothetical protein
MFIIIVGSKQMGWKALFAPLVIVILIFIMGLNFVHPLFMFFLLQNSNKVRFCKWTNGI